MATITDVVSTLIKQTEAKSIKWQAFHWDNDGVPGGWSTTTLEGCQFSVITDPLELSMADGGRLITLVSGAEVRGLKNVVASMYGERQISRNEALAKALDCLQGAE